MELILKSNNKNKIEQVLALARQLGISVTQKEHASKRTAPIPPKGKKTFINELLETFGEAPDFPTEEELRTKTWPSSW